MRGFSLFNLQSKIFYPLDITKYVLRYQNISLPHLAYNILISVHSPTPTVFCIHLLTNNNLTDHNTNTSHLYVIGMFNSLILTALTGDYYHSHFTQTETES